MAARPVPRVAIQYRFRTKSEALFGRFRIMRPDAKRALFLVVVSLFTFVAGFLLARGYTDLFWEVLALMVIGCGALIKTSKGDI